jgi:DNA-binding NarL/FixJ family response regulator
MTRLPESRIRILVVDAHPLVRKGIESILAVVDDLEMVVE